MLYASFSRPSIRAGMSAWSSASLSEAEMRPTNCFWLPLAAFTAVSMTLYRLG